MLVALYTGVCSDSQRGLKLGEDEVAYRQKGLHYVRLDRAQWLVLDHHEDLLLLLQVNEVTKP